MLMRSALRRPSTARVDLRHVRREREPISCSSAPTCLVAHAGSGAAALRPIRGPAALAIFHGASVETARLLRAADAYVQPSHYESFSNALIEAMATGLPVVASRVGGMRDCIVDGENGLFANPQDAADLARKLRTLLDNPQLAARLGAKARQTMVDQFAEPLIMGQFAELFEQVGQ